jgi:hypothetical protein
VPRSEERQGTKSRASDPPERMIVSIYPWPRRAGAGLAWRPGSALSARRGFRVARTLTDGADGFLPAVRLIAAYRVGCRVARSNYATFTRSLPD